MPPELQAEVQQWLYRARLDDQAADQLLAGPRILTEVAVYHCQKLAEKALKAYLVYVSRPFPRTHDLVDLANRCAAVDPSFVQLSTIAQMLAPYASMFRYPTEELPPTELEAHERLVWARQVLAFVLQRLPPQARP